MAEINRIAEIHKVLQTIEKRGLVDKSLIDDLQIAINKIIQESSDSSSKRGINRFLKDILNEIPDPVFIKDSNHIWVLLNQSACTLFGYEMEELIGKSDYDIFNDQEADGYWRDDKLVLESGKDIRTEEFQTHPITGVRRILDTKKTRYIDSYGNKYIIGVIRDITEQKLAQQKLTGAIASKEKIFSIMAHDLKEPFNTLLGFSSLLRKRYDNLDDAKRVEFINSIDSIANNAYSFVENILDWAATQTDKISYNPEYVSVSQVIKNIMTLLKETADKKKIRVEINIVEKMDTVYVDRNMLSTIFRNLISNAIKFTDKNGEVVISSTDHNDKLICFCVSDNGVGIPKEIGKKIFKESESISSPGTFGEKGIGLGLILCKDFVNKNGGSIWFEPNGDKGTKFCFTLPTGK